MIGYTSEPPLPKRNAVKATGIAPFGAQQSSVSHTRREHQSPAVSPRPPGWVVKDPVLQGGETCPRGHIPTGGHKGPWSLTSFGLTEIMKEVQPCLAGGRAPPTPGISRVQGTGGGGVLFRRDWACSGRYGCRQRRDLFR